MALETVTGFVTSFARSTANLPGLQLWFVPTGNGVGGDHLFATAPVPAAVTQATGAFTVQLERTDAMYGVPDGKLRYYPRITWLDAAGQYVSLDFVQWAIHVPLGGGTLEELLDAPSNADALYFFLTLEEAEAALLTLSPGSTVYIQNTAPGATNYYEVG